MEVDGPGILSDRLGLMSGRAQVLATGYRLGDLDDPPQVRCPRQEPLRKALPKELRVGGVRLAALAVSFLFFGFLSVLLVVDELGLTG